MKVLLLFAIRLYWRFWPEERRRQCLYRESCSRHVYRLTRAQGFIAGIRRLIGRFRTCRPGYKVYTEDENGRLRVRFADGSCIDASEAAPHVLAPCRRRAQRLEETLDSIDGSPASVRVAQDSIR